MTTTRESPRDTMGRLVVRSFSVVVSLLVAFAYYQPHLDLAGEWFAARAALDGIDPYQPIRDLAAIYGHESELQYTAPRTPAALLLFAPVALVPYDWLWIVGVIGVVGVFATTAWILFGREGLVALPLFFATSPGWATAVQGHLSMALLALCGALAVRRQSGAAAAVATSLKLFPGLWLLALAVTRRWRAFWIGLGAFVGLNLAGLLLPGVSVRGAIEGISSTTGFSDGNPLNGSLIGWGVPLWVVAVLGVAFATFFPRTSMLRASLPASILLSPVAWIDYLALLFAVVSRRAAVVLLVSMAVAWAFVDPVSNRWQILGFSLLALVWTQKSPRAQGKGAGADLCGTGRGSARQES